MVVRPYCRYCRLIVIRTSETEIVALSSTCTHKGCQVNLPENNAIICPCHRARFDLSGMATKGPAKLPLRRYAVTFTYPVVTIDLQGKEK